MVEVVLAETRREAERLGGDGFVLEPARVRHEAGVQAQRRLACHLSTDLVDQPRH